VERRHNPRYELWLPVAIDGLEASIAVTHNASENGLYVVTSTPAEVGAKVSVSFEVPEGGVEFHAEGTIVRAGRNEDDPYGLWPYAIAVQFESPLPDLTQARPKD
jgi:hypothetical protein